MKGKEKRELVEETRKKVAKQYSERICMLEKTIGVLNENIGRRDTEISELRKKNNELETELLKVKNSFEQIKSVMNLTDEERNGIITYFDEKMKNEKNISTYLDMLSKLFI